MSVIETEKATDVIVEYFDLICDTDYAFDETEILRRMNANAIDAVPVIRCKDCKYYEVAELNYDGTPDKRCKPSVCTNGKYAVERPEDWYCGDAEPKDGEE